MAKLKLTYFDFNGGRGEPARLALSIGNIPFDDDRVSFADWPVRKNDMPFGAVPVLEVDGTALSQSGTINRYVGRLANLYPSDPWQAALCDEIMDAIEDILGTIVATFNLGEAEKKAAREAIAADPLPRYLKRFQQRLDAQGGTYFADNRLTVADLAMFVWIKSLQSGQLDHISTDLVSRVAPKLIEHAKHIADNPAVKAYYSRHQVN